MIGSQRFGRTGRALLALLIAGCGAPSDDLGRTRIAARLITEASPSLAARDPGELFDTATSVDWRFSPEIASPWKLSDPAIPGELKPGRLQFDCAVSPCRLEAQVDLEAREIDALEISLSGANKSSARLRWATDGGPLEEDRVLVERLPAGRDKLVRFDVARHPQWRGRITALSLEPTRVADQRVWIQQIRGLRYALDGADSATFADASWSVLVGDEARPSRLAIPGRAFSWSIEVPPGGRLRFGTAVPQTWSEPLTFQVAAVSGGSEVEVFEAARQPGAGWAEHEVDLSPFAGGELELTFAAEGSGAPPIAGFAAWSGPEIHVADREERPHVVLVSVDTLRADHLSLYGYHRPTTPNLDRFVAERGVWFRNTVTSAPWTLPAHVSMLTGIDSLAHGVNHQSPMPEALVTAAHLFRAAGYRTVAYTGGGWLTDRYGFDRAFDRFHSWPHGRPRDSELATSIDLLLETFYEATTPVFAFLHTFEVHSPHDRREPFREDSPWPEGTRFFDASIETRREAGYAVEKKLMLGTRPEDARRVETEADWRQARAAYDNGIVHMDAELGRLLTALDTFGPNAVAVTSDHGEAFGEHGLASHGYLYDHNVLVPLVLAPPNGARAGEGLPGREIEQQVRVVDLLPTLLDYAGLQPPAGIDGRSLATLVANGRDDSLPRIATTYATSSNLGLALRTANRMKYVFNNSPWPPIAGQQSLFDLRADPGELDDLSIGADDELERMRSLTRSAQTTRSGVAVLRLANDGSSPLSGTLAGRCLQPLRVTSTEAGAGELRWLGTHATFELPAGRSMPLFFEAPSQPCVTITLEQGGRTFEWSIDDPDQPAAGRALGADGLVAIDAESALGTGLWWTPPSARLVDLDPTTDPALRAELEALGYLN